MGVRGGLEHGRLKGGGGGEEWEGRGVKEGVLRGCVKRVC